VNEETESGPARSGFTRPSIVGPLELYVSSPSFCQQTAPTVNAADAEPGSVTLPSAT
jgi:hypothetical protein